MLKRPKLKGFLTIFPISETVWGLRGGADELWRVSLSDERAVRVFVGLLPFLNGRHETAEIIDILETQGLERAAALAMLDQLRSSWLIEEADPCGLSDAEVARFRSQITFFSRFTNEGGSKLQAQLRRGRVGLVGAGSFSRSVWRQLEAAGLGEVVVLAEDPPAVAEWRETAGDHGTTLAISPLDRETIWPEDRWQQPPRLMIVAQEAHDPELLMAIDACAHRHGIPWLLLRALDFHEGWVGPLFIPGETADYRSLDARLTSNLPFYSEHQSFDRKVRASGGPATPLGGLHAFFDLLAAIAVIETVKLVSEIRVPFLAGRFMTVNLWSWETEVHELLRLPRLDDEDAARPAVFPWQEVLYAGAEDV